MKLIEKLINLGVVKLEINGTEFIPQKFITNPYEYSNGTHVQIDNKIYSNSDKIIVKSINIKKLKDIVKTLNSIISLSNDDEVGFIEFNRIKAVSVLKSIDTMENDFERLDYISSIIKEKNLFDLKEQENEYAEEGMFGW
jgi:hypothetical protein